MQFIEMPGTDGREFINGDRVWKVVFQDSGHEGEVNILFMKDENNIHQTINFSSLKAAQDWHKKVSSQITAKTRSR